MSTQDVNSNHSRLSAKTLRHSLAWVSPMSSIHDSILASDMPNTFMSFPTIGSLPVVKRLLITTKLYPRSWPGGKLERRTRVQIGSAGIPCCFPLFPWKNKERKKLRIVDFAPVACENASQPIARPISDLWITGRGERPPRKMSSSIDVACGGVERDE